MATFTVLGAGMMGSALCVPLVDAGHEVRLVGTHLDDAIIASLRATNEHPGLGLALPTGIQPFTHDQLGEAMQSADVIGIGVSSPGVRWAGEHIAPHVRAGMPIVMITKGLACQGGSLVVLPDVLRDCLPESVRQQVHPVAVAGPCIAGELACRVPTAVMLTSRDATALELLSSLMATDYYHLQRSTDVVSVEACAALKNAFALGVAFAWGLHEARGGQPGSVAMHNHEAAVFAQAILEMRDVVAALGADPNLASGLPGAGDLYVTCNAGRTGRFGRLLGLGLSLPEAIDQMQGATLECLDILRILHEALPYLERQGALKPAQLPLLRHLAAVALEGARVAVPFDRFG